VPGAGGPRTFDEAHGFAVNLVFVVALAVTGAAFLSGRPRLIRPVLIGFTVLCLADWVLIEDLGFLGGLGTDPNSMVPFVLLAATGYLALARVPEEAAEPAAAGAAGPRRPALSPTPSWRSRSTAPATPVNFPAPAFSLTSQDGRAVTLASLHGKVVLLTFLDDTCRRSELLKYRTTGVPEQKLELPRYLR
jgi:hypothetical protein